MAEFDTNRIPVNRKLLARFFKNVRIDPDITFNGVPCWLWTHPICDGYGKFSYESLSRNAHRMAFEMFVQIIKPRRNHADHLCRNRRCVNPVHIEAVSARINMLRGTAPSAKNAKKAYCVNGHKFTPNNTRTYGPDNRFRACKACRKRTDALLWRKTHPVRTHCKNGHIYTSPPVKIGIHRCLICVKIRQKARVRDWRRKGGNYGKPKHVIS